MRLKSHRVENSGPQTQSAKEIQMQRIIKHFAGDISFETSDLKELADKLTQDDDRDHPDSDSTESHIDTPTNDYSIDTLSTSTMRMYFIASKD